MTTYSSQKASSQKNDFLAKRNENFFADMDNTLILNNNFYIMIWLSGDQLGRDSKEITCKTKFWEICVNVLKIFLLFYSKIIKEKSRYKFSIGI